MQFSILISHYSLCLLLLLLLPINHATSEPEECQTYIIHMDHSQKPASFLTHESWHQSIVNSLLSTADDREMLLYSYNHVMHGFSARLTPSQLSAIEKSPAHLATYPESFGKLFTTYRSFLYYHADLAYGPLLHLVKVLSSELLIQESG